MFPFVALLIVFLFRLQDSHATAFHVQGDLFCHGEPYMGARVTLMEYDCKEKCKNYRIKELGICISLLVPIAIRC